MALLIRRSATLSVPPSSSKALYCQTGSSSEMVCTRYDIERYSNDVDDENDEDCDFIARKSIQSILTIEPKMNIYTLLLYCCSANVKWVPDLTKTVKFFISNSQQQELVPIPNDDADVFDQYGCTPRDKFAIIVHSWTESSETPWVLPMLWYFSAYRRGCIMVMLPNFDRLTNALVTFIRRLLSLGFESNRGFLFGFSYGAQMVLEAGRRLGDQKLARIDVCEPAGAGFDGNLTYNSLDMKSAANAVQCIFTSLISSTVNRTSCHINWHMGTCGFNQPAEKNYFELGSHGLCPYFYNSAFDNPFVAMKRPHYCPEWKRDVSWPKNFMMGYHCDVTSGVTGDFYSKTTKDYPYV
ncbi:uncharacterized protein LOC129743036 [Uranotaenia lowii]|uniref:uncharacterized protein LOC129743036 n=1 Tax=Uranotaenia lowii TaxID=190385 RepID=UPI00247B2A0F|nr:uncharacterized protein LOC129743036 [Uranotaenia lowii]